LEGNAGAHLLLPNDYSTQSSYLQRFSEVYGYG